MVVRVLFDPDFGVLACVQQPPPVILLGHDVERSAFRVAPWRVVDLPNPDGRHVGAQELRVHCLVGDLTVPAGCGQHSAGELGDRVEADEDLAVAGRPEGVGVEECKEPLDVFGALSTLDSGDDLFDGVDICGFGIFADHSETSSQLEVKAQPRDRPDSS